MPNSVVVDGKKFYELIVTDIKWHDVERIGCDARQIVQFEVDFVDPQRHDPHIIEQNFTLSLQNVIADELFFRYLMRSLYHHSKVFVSIHCGSDHCYVQGVLPKLVPICKKSDEKKLADSGTFEAIVCDN